MEEELIFEKDNKTISFDYGLDCIIINLSISENNPFKQLETSIDIKQAKQLYDYLQKFLDNN